MINDEYSLRDEFMNYLLSRFSSNEINELLLCYDEIENLCLKNHVLNKPLFQTTDLKTLELVQRTIWQNKSYKMDFDHRISLFSAAREYCSFIESRVNPEDDYDGINKLDKENESPKEYHSNQHSEEEELTQQRVSVESDLLAQEDPTVSVKIGPQYNEAEKILIKEKENQRELLANETNLVSEENNKKESIKDEFLEALSSKTSTKRFEELLKCFDEIEEVCLKNHILKKPLFETVDLETLNNVQESIWKNYFNKFKTNHRITLYSAARYYYTFIENRELKEINVNVENSANITNFEEENIHLTAPNNADKGLKAYQPGNNDLNRRDSSKSSNSEYDNLAFNNSFNEIMPLNFDEGSSVSLRDDFINALSLKVSQEQLDKLLLCYDEIDKACLENKILITPLFQTTDLKILDNVQKAILRNELGKFDKNKIKTLYYAARYYYMYIKSLSKENSHLLKSKTENIDLSDKNTAYEQTTKTVIIRTEEDNSLYAEYPVIYTQIFNVLMKYSSSEQWLTVDEIISEIPCEDRSLDVKKVLDNASWSKEKEGKYRFSEELETHETGGEKAEEQLLEKEETNTIVSNRQRERYCSILRENFPNGLKNRYIHFDKFVQRYESSFGEPLEIDYIDLWDQLKSVGLVINDRIYPPLEENQLEIINKIFVDVEEILNRGGSRVYISQILERYSSELSSQINIYNENDLKSLLDNFLPKGYVIDKNYIVKTEMRNSDPANDVFRVLADSERPMTYEMMQRELWYLPLDDIKKDLTSFQSIVNVDKDTYFYAPNFPIDTDELLTLTNAMKAEIEQKEFLVKNDLMRILEKYCPMVASDATFLKDWGIREVLGYLLKDEFNFNGAIICLKGQDVTMDEAYRLFCRNHKKLTLNELKAFSQEVGVQIYWDSVLKEMIRVSEQEFVNKTEVFFDVNKADEVIEMQMNGDYIALKDVGCFLQFPNIGWPWNGYILESYTREYSNKFKLIQTRPSQTGFYGAILQRTSKIKDYREFITDFLANNDDWWDEDSALNLIVEKGFQAKRAWKEIGSVTKEAKIRKEQQIKG